MACSNCGKELMEAAVFCIYCGTPVAATGREPLKPGKLYGVIALLCAAEIFLAVLVYSLTIWLLGVGLLTPSITSPLEFLWAIVVMSLCLLSPFCAIAGIVYGILGYNTEGRRYAYAGLVLSVLYTLLVLLLVLPFIAYILLVPPFIAYIIFVLHR